MKAESKTKNELIAELKELRQQNKRLETRQKRAEKASRKGLEQWQALFQSIRAAVVVHTANSEIIMSNNAAQELLGLNGAQMLGKKTSDPAWNFLREDGSAMPLEEYPVTRVLDTKQPLKSYSAGIRKPNGSEITWVIVDAVPIFDQKGEVFQVVVSFMDNTDRKRTIEALRKSEELAKACLNATTDMVYLLDPDGHLLTANSIASQRLGKTPEELSGVNIFDFFPSHVAEFREEKGDQVVRSGKPLRFSDEREGRFFDNSIYPTFDAQGKVDRLAVFVADITERKRAEKDLAKAKELFSKAFYSSPLPTVITSLKDGTIRKVNHAFTILTGYKENEIAYQSTTDLGLWNNPEDREKVIDVLLETGSVRDMEIQVGTLAGDTRDCIFSAERVFFDNEPHFISMAVDVTERKQIEKVLRENEEKLVEAQRMGNMGHWEFDLDAQTLEWSDQMFKLFDRDPTLGTPDFVDNLALYYPDDAKRLEKRTLLALESGEGFEMDYKVKLPSGKTAYHYSTFQPIRDEKGRVSKLIGTLQDITERRQAEEVLLENEEKYRNLFHQSNDGIVLYYLDGTIIDVNQRVLEQFGYRRSEILSLKVRDLIPTGFLNESRKAFDRIIQEGYVSFEITLKKRNAEIFPAEVSASLFEIRGKKVIQGIVRDIAKRKQAQREQERLIIELREAYSKVKILSGMLPICTSCKKIRDDRGYWNQIEAYIRDHSEAEFSHGLCPECADKMYSSETWYKKK